MARHRHHTLPRLGDSGVAVLRPQAVRRTLEQQVRALEEYAQGLVTALDEVLRDIANTGNVNANSALVANEGESLPTASEDLLGRLILQRIASTQSGLWYTGDNAAGAPTLYPLLPCITGEVTLAVAPATTTAINNSLIVAGSRPFLYPKTANAAGVVATTYATSGAGTVTVTHAAAASADRTFHYVIFI